MTRPLDVPGLAHAYRRLVLWFGAQLVLTLALQLIPIDHASGPALMAIFAAAAGGALVTIIALAYYGYKTAAALGSDAAIVWAIAMFVPCVNVVTLLILSSQATSACRANGIPVGFFGPKV